MRSTTGLLSPLPGDMPPERAVFVNLLEVALNCALDVPVRFGDVVVVYGYGVVGGFFCRQLSRRTAGRLVVVDPVAERRSRSPGPGADAAVSPAEAAGVIADVSNRRGADICIDASGAPSAVQDAVRAPRLGRNDRRGLVFRGTAGLARPLTGVPFSAPADRELRRWAASVRAFSRDGTWKSATWPRSSYSSRTGW